MVHRLHLRVIYKALAGVSNVLGKVCAIPVPMEDINLLTSLDVMFHKP